MLKHLYKTLLVGIISGSLLTLNTSVVMAATQDGETVTTTDSNGIITAKKNYKFEKISDSDMLASIMMLAGGYVTGRMLRVYKPPTMDVMVAAAGGVAYIAGEVITNVKFKGKIDAMTVEVEKKNDGTVNEEQVKRLQDLKTSYEEAKKTTGYKKMLQLGSAAAFGAAGVMAAYMAYAEHATAATCKAAIAKSEGELTACINSGATGATASEAASCSACATELKAYNLEYLKYINQRAVPKLSFYSNAQTTASEKILQAGTCFTSTGATSLSVKAQIESACVSSVTAMVANQTNASVPGANKTLNINQQLINKYLHLPAYTQVVDPKMEERRQGYLAYFDKALDLLFPKVQASWLPLLGLGASTTVAFVAITGTSAAEMDTLMFVPRNRAIGWGLFAAAALLSAKSSDNVMKKLDANIAKIDSILADLNKLSAGVKAQNLTQQGISISTVNPGVVSPVSFSTDSTANTECMAANSSTNCAALSGQLSSMPGFANLPDSFKDIATQSVALGDSLSGANTVSGSTLSSADSLGSKQNAIAKLLKAQQAKLDKATGKSLQKDQDKLEKSLAAKIKKALETKGMTATGFMASVGATPIDSSLKNKDLDTGLASKGAGTANAVNLQAGTGADKDAQSLKLDFKEASPSDSFSMGAVNSAGANKEYDIKSPEINGEFGPTLFELISGRYIKSGYPKLLEEEPTKN